MKAYIKKDKNHDVLGNRILTKEELLQFEIPREILPIVIINNRTFFYSKDKIQFQCTKCLNVMYLNAKSEIDAGADIRRIFIDPNCQCTRI